MALIFYLLLLTSAALGADARPQRMVFPAGRQQCTSGFIQGYLRPSLMTCTCVNVNNDDCRKWDCHGGVIHCLLFFIHESTVHCRVEEYPGAEDSEVCDVHFEQHFSVLGIIILGGLSTMLCGFLLGIIMYIGVVRLATQYENDVSEAMLKRTTVASEFKGVTVDTEGRFLQKGYGSFGGRLYTMGELTSSLRELLDAEAHVEVEEGDCELDELDELDELEAGR